MSQAWGPIGRVITIVTLLTLVTRPARSGPAADGAGTGGAGVSWSLRADVGVLQGEARELVYSGGDTVSELTWDLENVVMAGGRVSARFSSVLRVHAALWYALTKGTGGMEDYDWLLRGEGTPWTDFSASDVDLETGYTWDLGASVQLVNAPQGALYAIVGFKQDFWEWRDFGVRFIYSSDPARPEGFRDVRGNFGGETGITYEQRFDIPYFGVGAATARGRFSGSAYLLYSPFVTAEDRDHHILRELHFREEFEGGDFIGGGLEVTVRMTDTLSLTCALDGQVIPEFTGDLTVTSADGTSEHINNAAGIENQYVLFSAGVGAAF